MALMLGSQDRQCVLMDKGMLLYDVIDDKKHKVSSRSYSIRMSSISYMWERCFAWRS